MAALETHLALTEAERLFGQPRVQTYDLGACGDEERFWEMWQKCLAEVVLVIRRPGGRLLLQTKSFYPPGAFRLPTGGVRPGEELLAAVQREMLEETGLEARITGFLGILRYRFGRRGESMERASYVFVLESGPEAPRPQDETERISGFREVPAEDLQAVIAHLESLRGEWAVWGRFRALVHSFVAEEVAKRQT
jgi:8-oxo-dGTP pyrophosphatase MutT (NUDIX family)